MGDHGDLVLGLVAADHHRVAIQEPLDLSGNCVEDRARQRALGDERRDTP
jgi:hypothetical protein